MPEVTFDTSDPKLLLQIACNVDLAHTTGDPSSITAERIVSAIEALAASPEPSEPLAAELRDAIAECLYEAANENEHGPGGGVKHWREFTDSWVMGAVREVVEAGLASREAEVRRKVADEIQEAGQHAAVAQFLESFGLEIGAGPGATILAVAAAVRLGAEVAS